MVVSPQHFVRHSPAWDTRPGFRCDRRGTNLPGIYNEILSLWLAGIGSKSLTTDVSPIVVLLLHYLAKAHAQDTAVNINSSLASHRLSHMALLSERATCLTLPEEYFTTSHKDICHHPNFDASHSHRPLVRTLTSQDTTSGSNTQSFGLDL